MVAFYVSLTQFFCISDPYQRFLKWIRIRPNDTDPTYPDPDPKHCFLLLQSVVNPRPPGFGPPTSRVRTPDLPGLEPWPSGFGPPTSRVRTPDLQGSDLRPPGFGPPTSRVLLLLSVVNPRPPGFGPPTSRVRTPDLQSSDPSQTGKKTLKFSSVSYFYVKIKGNLQKRSKKAN